MADKRSTSEWKIAKIGGYEVSVKITTIYNIEPTQYVSETPCPFCGKTAVVQDRLKKKSFSKSVENMKSHYEAIHIRGSHNPTKKRK